MPASYGGFETLVERLIDGEHPAVAVYCSSKNYPRKLRVYHGAALHYLPLSANGAQSILYDIISICHGLRHGYRSFLILGVSGAIVLPLVKILFPSTKVVTNIDGIEWRRDKWGWAARSFLRLSERIAVQWSDTTIADNEVIREHVEREYSETCVVIPYGGEHATLGRAEAGNPVGEYDLALCRIEPENNVEMILEAYSQAGTFLKFIGNWENSAYGKELRVRFSRCPRIELLDPIYDLEALYRYRSECRFYIHGHSAGGTNPSLVEIMHFSKPVIAFNSPFNRATMENHGRYFNSERDLREALLKPPSPEEGVVLAEIAQRRYTWKVVKDSYFSLFRD